MTTNTSADAASALALQRLILDEDLEHLEDLLAEFNLFDVLKIERRELQHSALLAWLLDPSVSIFMVIRPAIFTDIQPPRERGELTIIRLWLAGQSPPLRPAERGVARAVPGSWRPR